MGEFITDLLSDRAPTGENENLTREIDNEWDQNQDFLIGNFTDEYENLIYKTHLAYEYIEILENCESVSNLWYVHQDDDTFFDIDKLNKFKSSYYYKWFDGPRIICGVHTHWNVIPMRKGDSESKYIVSEEQWPIDAYYPNYCGGPCTIIRGDAAVAIREESKITSDGTFGMEDVLFTGVFREKAGLRDMIDGAGICQHTAGDYNKLQKIIQKYCQNNNIQFNFV